MLTINADEHRLFNQFHKPQDEKRMVVILAPDGHPKLPHLWPVKLLQAGRSNYEASGLMAMRAAASLRR